MARINPQGTQQILDSIDLEDLSEKDRAFYCLLKVENDYLLGVDIKSDSLINIAMDYYQNNRGTDLQLGMVHYLKGRYYFNISELHAIKEFIESEKYFINTDDSARIGLLYARIAGLYMNQNDYKNSLKYNHKALDYTQKLKERRNINSLLINIGQNYKSLNNYDTAKIYFEQSYKSSIETNDSIHAIYALSALSRMLLEQSNLIDSEGYLKKALQLSKDSIDNMLILAQCYVYQYIDSYKDEAIQLAYELVDRKGSLYDAYLIIARLEYEKGNYQKVYEILRQLNSYKDIQYKSLLQENVYRCSQLYNREQSMQELARAEHVRYVLIFILMSILVFAVGIVIYFVHVQRHKKLEYLALRSELNDIQVRTQKYDPEVLESNKLFVHFFQKQLSVQKELASIYADSQSVDVQLKRIEETIYETWFKEEWTTIKDGINLIYNKILDFIKEKSQGQLTETEVKVFVLMRMGFRIPDIAAYLNISQKTIYNSRCSLKKKLNIGREIPLTEIVSFIQQECDIWYTKLK